MPSNGGPWAVEGKREEQERGEGSSHALEARVNYNTPTGTGQRRCVSRVHLPDAE